MTFRAQIETLLVTGDYPGDAEATEMLGCSPLTAMDYRQRWQRANSKQHKNGSGIMPREVVEFIFDLRNDEMLQFKEIARRVNTQHGEYYGIKVTAGQCGNVYRQHGYVKPARSQNIDPNTVTFPLETVVGTMYGLRIRAPKFARTKANKYKTTCDFCPYYEQCRKIGSVCRCETVWESEVL